MRSSTSNIPMTSTRQTALNSFERFLIRKRVYCERCSDLTHATTIREFNGRKTVMCDMHAARLDAARKSEKRQLV